MRSDDGRESNSYEVEREPQNRSLHRHVKTLYDARDPRRVSRGTECPMEHSAVGRGEQEERMSLTLPRRKRMRQRRRKFSCDRANFGDCQGRRPPSYDQQQV